MALKVVALAGGVGGAKLADGLARELAPEDLTVVVNCGDDFVHLGMKICPDLDTVVYTLAGLANPKTGWGRADESWNFLDALDTYGGPTWFQLGDRDLALHVERTRLMQGGCSLSQVTGRIASKLGVEVRVLPASDDPVPTIVLCEDRERGFQEYFVAERCRPTVRGFRYQGVEQARPAPGVQEAIEASDVVVFCPSNPWVSLDPILTIPGIGEALDKKPVIGVSPIVGGRAIRGPAAKMYSELGIEPSALAVAEHYRDRLSGFVIDTQDEAFSSDILEMGIEVKVTNTVMLSTQDRQVLAGEILAMAYQSSSKEN